MIMRNEPPETLLADFDAGSQGLRDVDMRATLWAIVEDVRDSYRKTMKSSGIDASVIGYIDSQVDDYLTNHYGD
jgi:hypothetical protein